MHFMTKQQTTPTDWSTVIDVVLQLDTTEGTYSIDIYNADESRAAGYLLDAVIVRAAMLEATALLKDEGFDPAGRWESDEDTEVGERTNIRKFRRSE